MSRSRKAVSENVLLCLKKVQLPSYPGLKVVKMDTNVARPKQVYGLWLWFWFMIMIMIMIYACSTLKQCVAFVLWRTHRGHSVHLALSLLICTIVLFALLFTPNPVGSVRHYYILGQPIQLVVDKEPLLNCGKLLNFYFLNFA